MGNIVMSEEEKRELKLIMLFDFYMWIILSKKEIGSFCPFDFEYDFDLSIYLKLNSKSTKKEKQKYLDFSDEMECSNFSYSLETKRIVEEETICSGFDFISTKSTKHCPCHQFGKEVITQLERLLFKEGFVIP